MFFFAPLIAMPYYTLVLVYVLAAVLPAVFLMRYVYRQDRIESEPPYLLGQLALIIVMTPSCTPCLSPWALLPSKT